MRFSLMYELQHPRPWADGGEERLLEHAIEQIRLADGLGYHAAWISEHHFLEEFSHSAAPAVVLGACAAQTGRIRLGLGPVPLPTAFRHPARLAGTASTLDLISGGRVELATSESSAGAEIAGFGAERDTLHAQWAEALAVLARMMVESPFSGHDGRWTTMPARNVVPKPGQAPHPPLWLGCPRHEAIPIAAQYGLGALSLLFADPEELGPWVDEYHRVLDSDRCRPAGRSITPAVAATLPMMIAADEQTAIERGIDGAHFHAYAQAHYMIFGDHRPGITSLWQEFETRRAQVGFDRDAIRANGAPLSVRVLDEGRASLRGAIGTADQVSELVERYERAGIDELLLCVQTGRAEHDHVCEALERFAADVMPVFSARRDERERERARRSAGAVQRALMRAGGTEAVSKAPGGGPDLTAAPGSTVARRPPVGPRMQAFADRAGERGLGMLVDRASEARIERVVGSRRGLETLLNATAARFRPERAGGFVGDIQWDLLREGRVVSWTVACGLGGASARRGPSPSPALVMRMSLADFARMASGRLAPGAALLTGRLDLEGDVALATRLSEMFGLTAGD